MFQIQRTQNTILGRGTHMGGSKSHQVDCYWTKSSQQFSLKIVGNGEKWIFKI